MGKRTAVLIFLLFAAAFPTFSAKSPSLSIEDKIAIESSIESKLKTILMDILGTDRVIVSINIELKSEEAHDEHFVLPGVPEESKLASAGMLNLGEAASKIKRVSSVIVLDRSLPEPDVELAKKVAGWVLGFNPNRGDQMNVETMAFRRGIPAGFSWKQFFVPPDLWRLCALLLGIVFMVYFKRSLPWVTQPLAASVRELANKLQGSGAAALNGDGREEKSERAAQDLAAAAHDGAAVNGEPAPFDFLKQSHANALHFLLQKESPEKVAIILHYAPGALAAELMPKLPLHLQAAVYERLAVAQEEDPKKVRETETEFKTKIQYLVGGEEKIGLLIEEADVESQSMILERLAERDSQLAARLKNKLVFIEDVRHLSKQGFGLLMRRVPMAVIARVLKRAGQEEVTAGLLRELPAGMTERLRQEMDLAISSGASQLAQDRKRVLEALRALKADGHLQKEEELEGAEQAETETSQTEKEGGV
ncbi:MAG: hypothetical protein HYT79_04450 [Elusimicrobia bacterium]|nr:hypothetical protein [Elusimicrobiota bacterium]